MIYRNFRLGKILRRILFFILNCQTLLQLLGFLMQSIDLLLIQFNSLAFGWRRWFGSIMYPWLLWLPFVPWIELNSRTRCLSNRRLGDRNCFGEESALPVEQ